MASELTPDGTFGESRTSPTPRTDTDNRGVSGLHELPSVVGAVSDESRYPLVSLRATRCLWRAFYDNTQYVNVYNFVRAEDVTPLLQESRSVRIEALEHFPEIVKALQAAAEKAIRTIEDAKKLVVGRGDAPENVGHRRPSCTATTQRIKVSASFRSALGSAQGVFISALGSVTNHNLCDGSKSRRGHSWRQGLRGRPARRVCDTRADDRAVLVHVVAFG